MNHRIITAIVFLIFSKAYSQNITPYQEVIVHSDSNNNFKAIKNNPYYKDVSAITAKELILSLPSTQPHKSLNVYNEFPADFVKFEDIDSLTMLLDSEITCKNIMHVYSSFISNKTAKLGDYAYWLIDSYRNKRKINIGLNFVPLPKSKKEKEELKIWWYTYKEKLK